MEGACKSSRWPKQQVARLKLARLTQAALAIAAACCHLARNRHKNKEREIVAPVSKFHSNDARSDLAAGLLSKQQ